MTSLPPPPPGIRSMDSRYYVANQKSEGFTVNPYINHYSSAETLFNPRLATTLLLPSPSTTTVTPPPPPPSTRSSSSLTASSGTLFDSSSSVLPISPAFPGTQTKSMTRIQQEAVEHEIMQTVETLVRPARDRELLSSLSSLTDLMEQLKHRYTTETDSLVSENKDTRNHTVTRSLSSGKVTDNTTDGVSDYYNEYKNGSASFLSVSSVVQSSTDTLRESIVPYSNAVDRITRMGNAPVPSRLIVTESSLYNQYSTSHPPSSTTTTGGSGYRPSPSTAPFNPPPSSTHSLSHDEVYYPSTLTSNNDGSFPTTLPHHILPDVLNQMNNSLPKTVLLSSPSFIGGVTTGSPTIMTVENLSTPVLPDPLYLSGNDITTTLRINNVLETYIVEIRRLLNIVLRGSPFILLHKKGLSNNQEERYRIHLTIRNDLRTLSWQFTDPSKLSGGSSSSLLFSPRNNNVEDDEHQQCFLHRIQKCTIDGQSLRWTIEYLDSVNVLKTLALIAPDRVIVQDWISAIKTLWDINQS